MKTLFKFGLIFCAMVSGFFVVMLAISMSSKSRLLESIGEVSTSNVFHYEYIASPVCQYKGCGAEGAKEVSVNLIDPYGSRIRESENYSINGKSYDKTETGYVPKKDTYLVPTDKGLKVETERGWEEKTYVTGSGRYTMVRGVYCAAHADAGEKLIQDEVKYAFTWASTGHRVLAVLAVLPWALLLWFCVKGGKKPFLSRTETNTKSQTP